MAQAGYNKRDLAVLYASMLATRLGFGVIIIIFPSYISSASDVGAAISLALYPIFEAGAAIPVGRMIDTRGRKKVFVVALVYVAILTSLVGLTQNFYTVSALHALMGIGAAGVTVASLTMITDLTSVKNRGAGMGAFDFANIGGYAAGLLVGGYLHTVFASDLGGAFLVTGAAIGGAFALSAVVIVEPVHLAETGPRSLNPLKALDPKTRAILPIWLALTALLGVAFFLPRAFNSLGIETSTTSMLLFLGVAALGVGSVGFGALSDRVGRDRILAIGVIGMLGLLSSVYYVSLSGLTTASLSGNIFLIGPFALLTSALVPSILATVGDRAREGRRGLAMGIYSLMLSGGIAFGTVVAGLAHSTGGFPAVILAGIAIFVSATLLSMVMLRRARKFRLIQGVPKGDVPA
jgi:MFS family permease